MLWFLELSTDDRAKLLEIVAKERDWRARYRALKRCCITIMGGMTAPSLVAK
jgi:hypothetical protein